MTLSFGILLLRKHGRGRFLIEPGLEQACLDGFCPQGSPPTVGELRWAIVVEQVSQPRVQPRSAKALPATQEDLANAEEGSCGSQTQKPILRLLS